MPKAPKPTEAVEEGSTERGCRSRKHSAPPERQLKRGCCHLEAAVLQHLVEVGVEREEVLIGWEPAAASEQKSLVVMERAQVDSLMEAAAVAQAAGPILDWKPF